MSVKDSDKAPDFSLPDQDGTIRSLADFAGKKLVLFFYPKANTGG
ncbi:MAG: redoxin domain-containing protein [Nitrospinae bacterium]|nr:redoxin domain-containing protein [Nitrospinota bacterium]